MTARASVHALDGDPAAGGGPAWALAVAGGLARRVHTTVVVPDGHEVPRLQPWVPADGPAPTVVARARARGHLDDLRRAWADRSDVVTVVQSPHPPRLVGHRRSVVLVDFPLTPVRTVGDRVRLAGYGAVVANSTFTADWVRRRWGRAATVLPPLVPAVAPRPKEPIVVSVGRFVGGARSKGQLALVDAFRRLGPEVHRTWSLHLAGFVADPAYLAAVADAARDLPVVLHADCSRAALEDLLGRAALCWHACGYGADAERRPERLEHFGISVVEAMSAGAVPLVYAAGGPAATVDGVVPPWHDADELVAATQALLDGPTAMADASDRAQSRALAFDRPAFTRRLDALVDPLLPA